ncbi:MAG: hypothetical protein ABIA02_02355 [Candidatus Falkowbacteria bacterium]
MFIYKSLRISSFKEILYLPKWDAFNFAILSGLFFVKDIAHFDEQNFCFFLLVLVFLLQFKHFKIIGNFTRLSLEHLFEQYFLLYAMEGLTKKIFEQLRHFTSTFLLCHASVHSFEQKRLFLLLVRNILLHLSQIFFIKVHWNEFLL